MENILNMIKDECVNFRRDLHQIPEVGFKEFKTQKYLKEKLESFGFKPEVVCQTGLIVFIDKGSKETIAYRSDIDALDAVEETGVSFCSTHNGQMHACGHDGHMSILLGFAKYLSTADIKKNILLIFQPAEEGPGGAKFIVDDGILDKYNVSKIFGLHLFPELPEGVIGSKAGPIMAQTAEVDIKITGKSGHGAMPHKTIDTILITAKLIEAYQSIVSRNVSPIDSAVVTFGMFNGGTARNIIAETCQIGGTIRGFSIKTFNYILERIEQINKGFELAYGVIIEPNIRPMYPPLINSKNVYEDFRKVMTNNSFNFREIEPMMLAEDFSYYTQAKDGLFFMLGTRNEEKNFVYPLHNSKFNFDEKVLIEGVKVYIALAKHFELI